MQGNEHTECKRQNRHTRKIEYQRQYCACEIQHPRCTLARHQRFDDRRHGVGLRSHQGILTRETIGFVQDNHHTAYGCRAYQRPQEFPGLLLGRCCTKPVTDFQIRNEAACHTQRCADYTADDHSSHHAATTLHTYGYKHYRSDNQRHQRHAAHGVTAHDGDSVRRHGGEEECNDRHHDPCHQCLYKVMQHAYPEEDEHHYQSHAYGQSQKLHAEVFLGAEGSLSYLFAFLAELLLDQPYCAGDDAPVLDDTQQTCHCDSTNTDVTSVTGIQRLWIHIAHTRCAQYRQDDPPREERTAADDGGIFQTDDITQAQYSCRGVDGKDCLGLHGDGFAPCGHARREAVRP